MPTSGEMEHKQEELKREMKHQQEIVNLTHELQETSLERQVLEEEMDREGFIYLQKNQVSN